MWQFLKAIIDLLLPNYGNNIFLSPLTYHTPFSPRVVAYHFFPILVYVDQTKWEISVKLDAQNVMSKFLL